MATITYINSGATKYVILERISFNTFLERRRSGIASARNVYVKERKFPFGCVESTGECTYVERQIMEKSYNEARKPVLT